MQAEVIICEWRPLKGEYAPRLIHNHDLMEAESIEELPQWIQERYAVLRLFDDDEDTPIGGWASFKNGEGVYIFIVPQPEDPVQLKEEDQ